MRYVEIASPLSEKVNDYFLYHGTHADTADEILASNMIKDKTTHRTDNPSGKHQAYRPSDKDQWGEARGVSLTRSSHFARAWRSGEGVIFVLDAQRLKRDGYRMVTVDYYGNRREAEEYVIGPIKNLDRYLIAVEASEKTALECQEEDDQWEPGHKRFENLLTHPKFRVNGKHWDGRTGIVKEEAPVQTNAVQWTAKNFQSYLDSNEYRIIWIDIAKFEQMFMRDRHGYVGPGGSHNAIEGRYERFGEWLKDGIPVEMPNVYVKTDWYKDNGQYHQGPIITFGNGRHRYSWMRDHGATAMPVLADTEVADEIERLCGTSERQTILTH